MFSDDGTSSVFLYGIHMGRDNFLGVSRAIYSPWEGIKQELSLSDKGDVDFDGPISLFDQIMIGNHIVGIITLTQPEKWAADVSPVANPSDPATICGDNLINIFDMIGVGNAIISADPILAMTQRCNI